MTPQDLGYTGELYVQRRLTEAGIPTHWDAPADLVAAGVHIEVKSARQSEYSRGKHGYQFCLHRDGRKGQQGHIVILLCYWREGQDPAPFVIPANDVGRRKSITIPGQPWVYAGKWAAFYDAWETIADELERGYDG